MVWEDVGEGRSSFRGHLDYHVVAPRGDGAPLGIQRCPAGAGWQSGVAPLEVQGRSCYRFLVGHHWRRLGAKVELNNEKL